MRIHLDLSAQAPTSYQPTKALKVAIHKCLFLLALIAALLSVQESRHRKTLLEGLSNVPTFQYLRMKCDNLEFPAAINHLKDNFLTNKRVNDDHLRTIYRDSGLSHLLALSGGQTVPAAYVISLLFTHCSVMVLRIAAPLIKGRYLIALFFVASIFEIFTLGFLVCLFQATGALSRALSNKWTELLRFCSKFCTCNVSASERWIWKTQLELAPWIIVWLIHKNPVHDLSFLLSLMGARTAGLVSLWCAPLNKINSTAQVESRTFNLLTDWLRTIIHWVIVTSLTSALMCLFCAQLWPIDNVIQKVQANLIAGPIVLFLVTPASLIVLAWIILTPTWPPRLLCDFLEWGLSLFHQAALTFSERGGSQNEHQLSFPRTPLESEWFENPYLSLLFIITALSMAHWFHQALRAKLNNIGH